MAFQFVRSKFNVAALLAATVLVGACAEQPVAAPEVATQPSAVSERIQCAVDVRTSTMACGASSTGGAERSITLGGQGTYVELTAGNASYGGGVFQADVRVRNLLAQQLGTTDGTVVVGIKTFIATGPTVTSGTGSVTVNNADGIAAFTGANQPYFHYNEILEVFSGTSASKTWRFNVPATVNAFTFTVLVNSSIPQEVSLLRWTIDRGRPVTASAVWAADANNVFACGTVCYRSGGSNGWLAMTSPTLADSLGRTASALGMHGTSPTDIWAVGGGLVAHYDGAKWTSMSVTPAQLNSVVAIAPNDVYAVGLGSNKVFHYDGTAWSTVYDMGAGGLIVRALSANSVWITSANALKHWDGSAWSTVAMPTTNGFLRGLWVVSDTDIWVGTTLGALYHYDGTSVTQVASPTTQAIWGFSGFSATNIYATTNGNQVLHWDGSTWTIQATLSSTQVGMMSGSSPTDMYVAGYNGSEQLHHFDGTSWSTYGALMMGFNDIWGNGASNVFAVGVAGSVMRYNGLGWDLETTGTAGNLFAVWGNSTDVWAVGNNGASVLRRTGGAWSIFPKPSSRVLRNVWGSSASAVWAVGDTGTIEKFNGTSWVSENSGTSRPLFGVGGSGPTDIWAVGLGGTILHYDGTAWSPSAFASDTTWQLMDVYAPAANNAWIAGAGTNGQRVLLRWDGSTWTRQFGITGPGAISCFSATAPNDLWVGGGNGVMHHWDGTRWVAVPTGVGAAVCPYAAGPQLVFGAGVNGTLLRGTR